jgi:hypothetical protein
MARRLPDDPDKRRVQIFKRCYQSIEHWRALMEDRGMPDVITTPEGEDIYLNDLLIGLPTLPRRQRQAFELICLQGYTETAARDEMLPNSRSSTPVQQYADSGLVRMVRAYDAKQVGYWFPPWLLTSVSRIKWRTIMATLHPLVRQGLEATRKKILAEIDGLQQALQQVDGMLALAPETSAPPAPPASTKPAPTPKPEGKPSLADAAKELAATG